MRPEDIARERVCFDVLRAVQKMDVLLVGGYAVSAYGPPRFSVDLDLVLEERVVPKVREALLKAGLSKESDWDGGGVFSGKAERWTVGEATSPSSVDLLIGGISDRVSGVTFTFETLRKTATRRAVRGLFSSSVAEPLVPSREALIGLKLHVARRIDFRDIVVLSGESLDRDAVASMIAGAPKNLILRHVRKLLSVIDTKEFKDSLKGVYMLDDRVYARYMKGARDLGLWLERLLRVREGAE
jgi:hypothetical protein